MRPANSTPSRTMQRVRRGTGTFFLYPSSVNHSFLMQMAVPIRTQSTDDADHAASTCVPPAVPGAGRCLVPASRQMVLPDRERAGSSHLPYPFDPLQQGGDGTDFCQRIMCTICIRRKRLCSSLVFRVESGPEAPGRTSGFRHKNQSLSPSYGAVLLLHQNAFSSDFAHILHELS